MLSCNVHLERCVDVLHWVMEFRTGTEHISELNISRNSNEYKDLLVSVRNSLVI